MIKLLHYLFIRDWMLKLFSLALAMLTWLAVDIPLRKEPVDAPNSPFMKEKTVFDVPVIVMSTAADVHEFKVEPAQVDVVVQGDDKTLRALRPRQIRAIVDLTGIESTNISQKRIEIFTPPGVTHVNAQPGEVTIISPEPPAATPSP